MLDSQDGPAVIAPAPVSMENYPDSDTVVIRIPRPNEAAASLQAKFLLSLSGQYSDINL